METGDEPALFKRQKGMETQRHQRARSHMQSIPSVFSPSVFSPSVFSLSVFSLPVFSLPVFSLPVFSLSVLSVPLCFKKGVQRICERVCARVLRAMVRLGYRLGLWRWQARSLASLPRRR